MMYFFHPQDNIAASAVVTTSLGTEDPEYPLSNISDLSYAKIAAPSKLLETSGDWIGNFGASQRCDFVVFWHNFDEALTVRFQQHSSNVWTSPTIDVPLVIPARRADDYTQKVFVDLRDVPGYTTGGLSHYRVLVSGTNSEALGLKILIFDKVRTLARDLLTGVVDTEHQTNITMQTDAGVPWAYDLGSAPRSLQGSVRTEDADAVLIRNWIRACAGRVKPTVIVPLPALNDAWLVRWSSGNISGAEAPNLNVMSLQNTRQEKINQIQLNFDEITAGDPEWY